MKIGQNGLGVVQVLIAIAATAGISYTIMQNSSISNKQQSKASFDQQLENLSNEIQTEMAKLENCTASLVGRTAGVALTSLRSGTHNTSVNPHQIVPGPVIFSVRKPNSLGIYIDGISFLTREEVDPMDSTKKIYNDVIRVAFQSGDVSASGVVRERAKGLGATSMSHDFVVQTHKDSTGKVITCFSDDSNVVKHTCESIAETVWNPATKKCEFPQAIPVSDLIDVYARSDKQLTTVPIGGKVGRLVKP